MTLEELEALGFDRSASDGEGAISVRCSCCAALVINGVPCHETGCPNMVHTYHCFECGCDVLMQGRPRPLTNLLCEDCANPDLDNEDAGDRDD